MTWPALLVCSYVLARPLAVCIPPDAPEPVQYAVEELQRQWERLGLEVEVTHGSPPRTGDVIALVILGKAKSTQLTRRARITVPAEPESFAIGRLPSAKSRVSLVVAGRDAVGAMYGLLELADGTVARAAEVFGQTLAAWRRQKGQRMSDKTKASMKREAARWVLANWHSPQQGVRPYLAFRAPNPFLSLPYPPDEPWWFLSEEFWRKYLDMLAHCRFNWLDIHGMYSVLRTNFPNIYPYFVTSPSFPEVGVPEAEKARNLAMLKKIVAMAKRRGIKVALMSYHASWNVPGGRRVPYKPTDENMAKYTRECVAELLRQVPDLGMIGFRIGESGRHEDFYQRSYLPGIADSGLDIPLYTRSWGANRSAIIALGRQYPGRFFLEIKYNGEQYGVPHIVAGGRMAGWGHYSYEAYTSYPRPFSIIWQIRANGTHRFFRWADPDYIRTTARACRLDGAVGFSLESIETYYPQMDYFHRPDCGHEAPYWVMDRYWMWYLLWGRLTYDPDDRLWQSLATYRLGLDQPGIGFEYLKRIKAASRIISLIYASHCLGPDHRNMAPELETGGDIVQFARVQPLDTFVFQSPLHYVANLLAGRPDGRITPLQVAAKLEELASVATAPVDPPLRTDEWQCWSWDNAAVAHLARYYAHKTRAAVSAELFARTGDEWQAADALREMQAAVAEWANLAAVTDKHYRYVHDTLRMHDPRYHWKKALSAVKADVGKLRQRIDGVRQAFDAKGLAIGHVPVRIMTHGQDLTIRATVLGDRSAKMEALVKLADGKWRSFPCQAKGDRYGRREVTVPARRLPADAVQYCLRASDGSRTVWLPAEGQRNPFLVRFTRDGRPQVLLGPAEATTVSRTTTSAHLAVRAVFADMDGIEKAWLWYKPLPSTRRWLRKRAQVHKTRRGWEVSAALTSSPAGVMYAVEAVDRAGLAARAPAFDMDQPDIPYCWLDPWPGPGGVEETVPLSKLPSGLLTRQRVSAIVLGREARTFHAAPAETKRQVLKAVEQGLNLVIFNQDFPGRFSFGWLPGDIRGGDMDRNELRLVGNHPITEGLPRKIVGEKIVNDALVSAGKDWLVLTDPAALAVYNHGKGHIVVCQLRVLQLFHQPECEQLVRQILSFARAGSDKPLLVLDPGGNDLTLVISLLDMPWIEPADGGQ